MKITLADSVIKVRHKDYLGFPGHNPNIKCLPLGDSDFIWYCAMGDGDAMAEDLRELDSMDKPLISVALGDQGYRDCVRMKNTKTHFSTNTTDWSRCVPYRYDPAFRAPRERRLLASFVGSFKTNPSRKKMVPLARNDVDIIDRDWWGEPQNHEVYRQDYLDIMSVSKFTFCPRGIGPSSMRLVDAMLGGSIPIMIDDKTRLFDQDLGEFCLWSGLETKDMEYALEIARRMGEGEYLRRSSLMWDFCSQFLLVDLHAGCSGTIGFTEYIRKAVCART